MQNFTLSAVVALSLAGMAPAQALAIAPTAGNSSETGVHLVFQNHPCFSIVEGGCTEPRPHGRPRPNIRSAATVDGPLLIAARKKNKPKPTLAELFGCEVEIRIKCT